MKVLRKMNIMGDWRTRLFTFACALAASVPAMAEPVIQSVSGSRQAGTEIVSIQLSEPLKQVPAGFLVQTPPRIAIDLPGVTNGTGKPSVEVNQGNVRNVNIASSEDRTRLVIHLTKPATYRAEIQGKNLIIVLDAGVSAAVVAVDPAARASDGVVRFAEPKNPDQLPLKGIDFRRGTDGAGRVIVDLASSQVGVDIQQQGKGLVVEFLRSSLPDNLRKRLDVVDFGTPVQTISSVQKGDRVRMVVEPQGAWEHSAYQSDTQFVLEIRPQKIDPNKLTQGPGFAGEKLSLNFQNIEVRALLQVIADFTNFNVVTSDTVTGNVTLRLKDVPWDQALDIILQSRGLGLRKSGNVLMIAPKDELNAKEKNELEAVALIASLEPVRSQSFQLNYTKAEELARGLMGDSGGENSASAGGSSRILSPRGTVYAEVRTNQLFVNDTPAKLEEVQNLIARVDIPVRQVLIEARIVEADDSFGRSLGVRLGGKATYGLGSDGRQLAVGGDLNAVGKASGQNAVADFANTSFVRLPAQSQGGYLPSSIAMSLFGSSSSNALNLEISAAEADGRGKIISSPRILTADQIQASIQQGTKIPYQSATSSGATSVSFVDATLKLQVIPQITPEGSVILTVEVNKDSVGAVTQGVPSINTKSVKTQVLVENGGTVVIGGIFEQTERTDEAKVPLLGDVPVLGYLFKNKTTSLTKTELLVFLTPRVVSDRTAGR
jgi:type IV pilus assembly protein PilQ